MSCTASGSPAAQCSSICGFGSQGNQRSQVDCKHWVVTPRLEVPKDTDVLPSVWAVRRKRNLMLGEITKLKARLNLHGGKQEFGMTYYDTYAPVVTWFAI